MFIKDSLEKFRTGTLKHTISKETVLDIDGILSYPNDRPRYNRLLFIMPQPGGYDIPYAPSPTYGYLSQLLEDNGYECQIVDLRLGGTLDSVLESINNFQPDIIGYCFPFSISAKKCVHFLEEIEKVTNLPIFIGGSHLSIRGHNILEDVPFVSAAIRGEGEYSLLALFKGVPLKKIPNLWIREGNYVVETASHGYITNLDRLPWPKYSSVDLKDYGRRSQIDILTSRGCYYNCSFCSIHLTQGKKLRIRSPEKVFEEICYWYNRGVRVINFIDDILNFPPERFIKTLRLIESQHWDDVEFSCSQGIRADACTEDMFLLMKKVGFKFLGFGVESASNRVLKKIHKGETAEQIEKTIKLACKMGFDVGLFFILGLPYETKTDAEKSLSLAKKYPVKYAKFHICIPYPGTKLSKWIDDNNLWYMEPSEYLDSFDYADLLVTYDNKGMTRDQILYYIKKSIKIDAFIRMKYAANRMSKKLPKWAADFIAGIIYHPLYFSRLRRMARQKGWIRIRNATAITLKLDN